GTLVVVSSMAAAKEVIATPIPTKEVLPTPIVVCPEIVPEWRPTGYIDLSAKYYGKDEHNHDSIINRYTRTQLAGAINLTEKSKFEFRARNYVNLKENDKLQKSSTTSNNMRFRYFYNHGLLGDSKVNFTSRVEYYNRFAGTDTHNLGYQARLEFAPYFDFMPSWANVSSFIVAPKLGYQKTGAEDSNYNVNTGLDFLTYTELPLGIDLELNMYNTYYNYGNVAEIQAENGMKDNQFDIGFEVYLYRNFELYAAGKNKLELTTEFGYETYDTYQSNALFVNLGDENEPDVMKKVDGRSYQAYALTGLQFTHQYSKTLKMYAWAGGEYKNWNVTAKSEASNWGWQPQVTVGFKSTF
ncbi:MAG: FomA family porin-like outer membrane protein, partial [Cetobacterium sp.]